MAASPSGHADDSTEELHRVFERSSAEAGSLDDLDETSESSGAESIVLISVLLDVISGSLCRF
jgi:hypothetical protein